jgi:exopolysaccharide production protein ExoQ
MVIESFIYVIFALRAVPLYRQIVPLVRANKFTTLLVLLAIVSTAWSVDPSETFRRSMALLGTTLIGIEFALNYSVRKLLRLLCAVLSLFVVLSIIVQVFFPGFIPDMNFDRDSWHGLLSFKGNFAKMVVLAAVAFLCQPRRLIRGFLVVTALTALAFALIFKANSKEALVILVGMVALFRISGALRWKPRLLTLALLASLVIGVPILYLSLRNLDRLTAVLDRDPTLTGRVTLWQVVLPNIEQSPVYGYGYSAFWGVSSKAANLIREEVRWEAPHAHNGYIDLTLGLGLVGLLLFAAGYIVAVRRAIQLIRTDPGNEAKWPLMFLTIIFLYQLTESSVVGGNSIFWIMYVAVSFRLAEISIPSETVRTLEIEHIPTELAFAGDANG